MKFKSVLKDEMLTVTTEAGVEVARATKIDGGVLVESPNLTDIFPNVWQASLALMETIGKARTP